MAGLTHVATDTLNPDGCGRCDLDFLSGKGTRNASPTAVPKGPMGLADRSDESLPPARRF